MKIDLGKVTSIQLTLAISIIPKYIAFELVREWFKNMFAQTKKLQTKVYYEIASIKKRSLLKTQIRNIQQQKNGGWEVIPIGPMYHFLSEIWDNF